MAKRNRATRQAQRAARGPVTWKRVTVAAAVALVLPLAAVAAFFVLSGSDSEPPGPPRAVIVDQLSLTAPNPSFAEEATAMLQRAGYTVDYIPGEEVTVELYRELPNQGYDILLVRAHAADANISNPDDDVVSLFTSQRPTEDDGYRDERTKRFLKGVGYSEEQMQNGDIYYGVPPAFVRERMKGNLDGATVILMGCDVLRVDSMGEAFVERGAGVVVGWDETVSASHTDAATLDMLRRMLEEGVAVEDAVAATMEELGPDPYYGSTLVSYPLERAAGVAD